MKPQRHKKILELIRTEAIETQEELANRLNEAGFHVTQATVSRDIRALKLTKMTRKDGRSYYAVLEENNPVTGDKYTRVIREALVSMDAAENLVVIKTVSGMAMAVAASLDSMKWEELLGCIAGDDTIMCAARTAEGARTVIDKLDALLHA